MNSSDNKAGFTFFELVVVMAIFSIIAWTAVSGINTLLPLLRLKSASMELKSDMQMARMHAVRRNTFVVTYFDQENSNYTIFSDDGGGDNAKAHNYVRDEGEKVFKNAKLHPHIKIIRAKFGNTDGRFAFNSRGALDGLAGAIYLQHRKKIYRGVAISRIGKITIKRSANGKDWYTQN